MRTHVHVFCELFTAALAVRKPLAGKHHLADELLAVGDHRCGGAVVIVVVGGGQRQQTTDAVDQALLREDMRRGRRAHRPNKNDGLHASTERVELMRLNRKETKASISHLSFFGMGWDGMGLDWIGLDWIGLDWIARCPCLQRHILPDVLSLCASHCQQLTEYLRDFGALFQVLSPGHVRACYVAQSGQDMLEEHIVVPVGDDDDEVEHGRDEAGQVKNKNKNNNKKKSTVKSNRTWMDDAFTLTAPSSRTALRIWKCCAPL